MSRRACRVPAARLTRRARHTRAAGRAGPDRRARLEPVAASQGGPAAPRNRLRPAPRDLTVVSCHPADLPSAVSGERFEFARARRSAERLCRGLGATDAAVHSVNAAASAAEVRPLLRALRERRALFFAIDLPGLRLLRPQRPATTRRRLMTDARACLSPQHIARTLRRACRRRAGGLARPANIWRALPRRRRSAPQPWRSSARRASAGRRPWRGRTGQHPRSCPGSTKRCAGPARCGAGRCSAALDAARA